MDVVGTFGSIFARPDLWAGTLRFAAPLTLAALGGVISERSGVVNIAMEGMMLIGAFFAVLVAAATHDIVLATLASVLCGGLIAAVHGVASIHLRANQIVSGMAINLLALGLTSFLMFRFYATSGTPSDIPALPDIKIPVVNDIPFVGAVIGDHNIVVWLSILAVPITWWFLFRTRLGLRIRAVGEHPRAADTLGISVFGVRYLCVILSGLLSGLGGAYLALSVAHSFSDNMTSGAGLHRAGRHDLREVASGRRVPGLPAVRVRPVARDQPAGHRVPRPARGGDSVRADRRGAGRVRGPRDRPGR